MSTSRDLHPEPPPLIVKHTAAGCGPATTILDETQSGSEPGTGAVTEGPRRLATIFMASFLAQVVQISAVPAMIALRLQSDAETPVVVGAVAAAPWIAMVAAGGFVPRLLQRLGIVKSLGVALITALIAVYAMTFHASALRLFWLNLLFGISIVIRWVAFDTWVLALAPREWRGRVVGAHETLMGCGIAAAPVVLTVSSFLKVDAAAVCIVLLLVAGCLLPGLRKNDVIPSNAEPRTGSAMVWRIPTALAGGALAGAVETSSISFLPVMAERGEFLLGSTAALFGFGLGSTLLQAPIGWLADRTGIRVAQLITAGAVLGCACAILSCASTAPILSIFLFIWGGAAGGMNTLAVIEAGTTVPARETSRAMTGVAMAYTIGSILGPTAAGVAEAALPGWGLSVAASAFTAGFLTLRLVSL